MRFPFKSIFQRLVLLGALNIPAWCAQPMAIYVSDLDTNITGEHKALGQDLANAIETALSARPKSFRVLERRKFNDVIRRQKLEKDLKALIGGAKASEELSRQLPGADGVVSGELKVQLDGVLLTVSITKMDSEKPWQARRKHTLYEWLNSDVQDREAESLAVAAAARLLPEPQALTESEDGPRGLELARAGKCADALPLLQNASAIDLMNTEIFFQMGRCQNESGEFTTASHTLTSALSRNPRRADLFVERARSFLGQKLYSRALEDTDQAVSLDHNSVQAVKVRGEALMSLGKYNQAVDSFYEVYTQDQTRDSCVLLCEAYRKNGASSAALTLEKTCATLR